MTEICRRSRAARIGDGSRFERPRKIRRAVVFGCAAAAIAVAFYSRNAAAFTPVYWLAFVKAHPISSPIAFIPIYAAAMLCFVPTLPLNLVAGALWGPLLGSILALAGSVSGAVLAFLLARGLLGQPFASRFDQELLDRMRREFARYGWRVMAFVRVNPLFPGPVNFLFGLTSMTLWTFFWSTTVFLIPLTVVFSTLGSSVGGLLLNGSIANLRTALFLAGASLAFVAICLLLVRDRYPDRSNPEL
jgi:uncharacterized membrane protein YdjX (TVP38/TMEM64 family)